MGDESIFSLSVDIFCFVRRKENLFLILWLSLSRSSIAKSFVKFMSATFAYFHTFNSKKKIACLKHVCITLIGLQKNSSTINDAVIGQCSERLYEVK